MFSSLLPSPDFLACILSRLDQKHSVLSDKSTMLGLLQVFFSYLSTVELPLSTPLVRYVMFT